MMHNVTYRKNRSLNFGRCQRRSFAEVDTYLAWFYGCPRETSSWLLVESEQVAEIIAPLEPLSIFSLTSPLGKGWVLIAAAGYTFKLEDKDLKIEVAAQPRSQAHLYHLFAPSNTLIHVRCLFRRINNRRTTFAPCPWRLREMSSS